MRKTALVLALLLCLSVLSGCQPAPSGGGTYDGTVLSYDSELRFFKLGCGDGKDYCFVVDDETELFYENCGSYYTRLEEAEKWAEFGRGARVTVESGPAVKSIAAYAGKAVEGWFAAKQITVTYVPEVAAEKPVIYLYPETETAVTVTLDYDGQLTCTYPRYDGAWNVTAQPDGTLVDADGQAYNYLYWEGLSDTDFDFSEGYCVPGAETASFLETALAQLGLTRREANEFIVYWLPLMEGNPYNLIAFQGEAYTDSAVLTVTPAPETVIRVFMAWKPLNEAVEIAPQTLTAPEREGFTLVEWGGTELK